MTKEEYDDLTEDSLVHFKNDDPTTNPKYYNWKIIHITSDGILVENDYQNPKYFDKDEVLEKMDITNPIEKIDFYKLKLESDHKDAWCKEMIVKLNRDDLIIIINSLLSAEENKYITINERDHILNKLNIIL